MSMFSQVISVIPAVSGRGAAVEPAPELTVVIPTFNERGNVALLIERLRHVLADYNWEVIFVDDDSSDQTSAVVREIGEGDRRVRCIRRIGRRGLAGACIEGMLASQARYIAVMDADLQHDETLLATMLIRMRADDVNLMAASRYLVNGEVHAFGKMRARVSRWSNMLARLLLGVNLSDPMSGFFMIQRSTFEELAPQLSSHGFKILLDIAATARERIRIVELPYDFRARSHGESKLDGRVAIDFLMLLISKLTRNKISYRFLLFCLVGLTGVAVHMSILQATIQVGSLKFVDAQGVATVGAIVWNFALNNVITYRDRRLTGRKLWIGLMSFLLICAIGAVSNVGVASLIYNTN